MCDDCNEVISKNPGIMKYNDLVARLEQSKMLAERLDVQNPVIIGYKELNTNSDEY